MDVPPLDGAEVVSLHNLGLFKVVARLLAGASREERARERDRYVQQAGLVLGGDGRLMAGRLHHRMVELARMTSLHVLPIRDVTTVDGALTAALLVSGFEVPHRTTIGRALTKRRAIVHSAPALHSQISETGARDDTNLRAV